jgi:hypothetical protein
MIGSEAPAAIVKNIKEVNEREEADGCPRVL